MSKAEVIVYDAATRPNYGAGLARRADQAKAAGKKALCIALIDELYNYYSQTQFSERQEPRSEG